MNVKNVILAGLVAFASALAPMTMAADVIAPIPFDRPAVVQVVNNFDGPYFGIGGTTLWDSNVYTPTISVGLDKRYDAVVIGGEVFGAVTVDGTNAPVLNTIGFDAKAGFVLTDNVAVFGLAGVEVDTNTAIARNAVGVGADVAINESVYATASYKYVTDLGTFDNADHRVTVGLKFPF